MSEREGLGGGGQTDSLLSREPIPGLDSPGTWSQDTGIVTWVEGSHLTNWATQAPLESMFLTTLYSWSLSLSLSPPLSLRNSIMKRLNIPTLRSTCLTRKAWPIWVPVGKHGIMKSIPMQSKPPMCGSLTGQLWGQGRGYLTALWLGFLMVKTRW